MKSLLPLAILAALAVATLCYESHESMESYEISPFINRRNANTFMSPQQRWRAKAQKRYWNSTGVVIISRVVAWIGTECGRRFITISMSQTQRI